MNDLVANVHVTIPTDTFSRIAAMIRYTGIGTLALLIIAGIPWYWQFLPQTGNEIWMGVPAWFAVSIAVSVAVSVLTAMQFAIRWPGESEDSSTEVDA